MGTQQFILPITSTEVLEKLLEGNEQVILDIKLAVLENFKKEKLLPIVDEKVLSMVNIHNHIRKEIKRLVSEEIKYEEIDKFVGELVHKSVQKIIEQDFDKIIDNILKDHIAKKLKKLKLA
jgi:hypothetical protein